MYSNILLSTDGSEVARKGVEHGLALAKAVNAKATVITVTEPLPVDYGSGHASGWIPTKAEIESFDAACNEGAGKVLDEVRAMAEQIGISVELLHVPNAHPATAIIETAKSRGSDLIVNGLSWASRPQKAAIGESNIGGPGGRKRASASGALTDNK